MQMDVFQVCFIFVEVYHLPRKQWHVSCFSLTGLTKSPHNDTYFFPHSKIKSLRLIGDFKMVCFPVMDEQRVQNVFLPRPHASGSGSSPHNA